MAILTPVRQSTTTETLKNCKMNVYLFSGMAWPKLIGWRFSQKVLAGNFMATIASILVFTSLCDMLTNAAAKSMNQFISFNAPTKSFQLTFELELD